VSFPASPQVPIQTTLQGPYTCPSEAAQLLGALASSCSSCNSVCFSLWLVTCYFPPVLTWAFLLSCATTHKLSGVQGLSILPGRTLFSVWIWPHHLPCPASVCGLLCDCPTLNPPQGTTPSLLWTEGMWSLQLHMLNSPSKGWD
jgi:hypothetical protein